MTDAVATPTARLEDYERFALLHGPSPVHRLARLTEHLGGPAIWAKREDVNSGLAFGGNKTRKLEYIVPDALAEGADTLVSIGGYQSNHTRQVPAGAAKLGLKCRLVQEEWVDWDDPVNDKVGNILLSRIMGADVRLDPGGEVDSLHAHAAGRVQPCDRPVDSHHFCSASRRGTRPGLLVDHARWSAAIAK